MSFFLRPARTTDAGKLGAMMSADIAAKPWKPRLYNGAQVIAFVGGMIDQGWVTVAEDTETPELLGFAAREGGFVHALFIAAESRNSGVGRALMEDAKARCERLDLWTFEANAGARRFYQREGFTEVARSDGSRNEEGLPDVAYRWQRAPADPAPDRPTAEKAPS